MQGINLRKSASNGTNGTAARSGFRRFRGEGIACGTTAWQGSEGSEGSKGKVSPLRGDEFYMLPGGSENRTTALRAREMQPFWC